jgi:Tfp pilus assembly protein PilO
VALSDWNEKRLLALTGGVVGTILVIMAGLDVYTFMEYGKLGKETADLRKEVDGLEERVAMRETKEKELEDAKAASREAELQLPDDEDIGSLRAQVSEQIKDFKGLSMTKLGKVRERKAKKKPGGASSGAPVQSYLPVEMEMEASGEFHHFGQFLNRLENRLERIVAVKGFEMSANKDGLVPKSPDVELKLQFEAYRYNVAQKKKAR